MVNYAVEEPEVIPPHTHGLGPAAAPAVLSEWKAGAKQPVIPEKPIGTMTIVSVFPRIAFNNNYNWGHFEMPACQPCQEHGRAPCDKCDNYAKLVVDARLEGQDTPFATDGSRRTLTWVGAAAICRSLVTEDCIEQGVFVAEGAEPTKAELAEARKRFRRWAENQVRLADEVWGQKRDQAWISGLAREAAKYLAAKREWLSETADLVDCEVCGERSKRGSIKCKCGHPFNWQRAFDLGLLNDTQERIGRAKGWIRAERIADLGRPEGEISDAQIDAIATAPVIEKRGPGRPRKVIS